MDIENKYGMRDQHIQLLGMLDDFLSISRKNGISFSMAFGSMLGTVRHKGFIPWDDDIDIIIDRVNYGKLEEVLSSSPVFELVSKQKETLWIPRLKRCGMNTEVLGYEPTIDLFLVDNMPDNQALARLKKLMILFVQGMIKDRIDMKKGSVFLRFFSVFCWLLGRLLPSSLKYRLLESLSVMSNNKNTKYCSTYNVEYIYVGRKYNGRLLKDLIEMDFESRSVPVSAHYDSYLKELYGDYMTPPKEKERKPKHSNG